MDKPLHWTLVLVAVLLTSALGACGYRTAPIGIEIRDAETKQPVRGATVSLESFYMLDVRGGHAADKVWTTDERGAAILDTADLTDGIRATVRTTDGDYTVSFAHPRLHGASGWLNLYPEGLGTDRQPQPVLRPLELQTLDAPAVPAK